MDSGAQSMLSWPAVPTPLSRSLWSLYGLVMFLNHKTEQGDPESFKEVTGVAIAKVLQDTVQRCPNTDW